MAVLPRGSAPCFWKIKLRARRETGPRPPVGANSDARQVRARREDGEHMGEENNGAARAHTERARRTGARRGARSAGQLSALAPADFSPSL